MNIWKLDDCDYVAGETLEQVLAWYKTETGVEPEEIETAGMDEKVNVAEEGEPPVIKTFGEVIAEMKQKSEPFPAILGCDAHYA